MITPSAGTISPARTSRISPACTVSAGISVMRFPSRRWATRGALSTSAFRSRSARATAKSSSTVPPVYIAATTIAASGAPNANAAIIEMSATASTPIRPAMRSRAMDMPSIRIAGTVPAVQAHIARVGRPCTWAASPAQSAIRANRISARRRKRSFFMLHLPDQRCASWQDMG